MMKKFFSLILAVGLLWALTAGSALAAQPAKTQAWVNGQEVQLEQPLFRQQGTTMVPMRLIFEALGAEVQYKVSNDTQRIDVRKDKINFYLKIGCDMAWVHDGVKYIQYSNDVVLDAEPVTKNGITFVPLRFVAETLQADVSWDEASQTIVISQGNTTIKFVLGQDCRNYGRQKPGPENNWYNLGEKGFIESEQYNKSVGNPGFYNNWDGFGSERALLTYYAELNGGTVCRSSDEFGEDWENHSGYNYHMSNGASFFAKKHHDD